MDWSHGHNSTIHNGISRIGFYTGGHAARFRDEDLADKWVEKSNEFIEQNKDKPFFLFFSSHDIHVPRMPHERFQGKTSRGFRGDSIIQMDWYVGELLKTLDRFKLTQNTLVVFCSDNGPVLNDGYADGAVEKIGKHRAAGKFSGGKYSVHEGGTRTSFITRWPGKIAPAVSDEVVCTIDLAASLASLTEQELADKACVDSFDVLAELLGQEGAKGHDHLVQHDNEKKSTYGLRVGDWKLRRYDKKISKNVVVEKKLANTEMERFYLFNLANDPSETKTVIEENADKAQELKSLLAQIIQEG